MNEITKVLRDNEECFDFAFMNNGVDGLLDDKFQDPKMMLIKFHLKQSQKKLLEAVIEEEKEKHYKNFNKWLEYGCYSSSFNCNVCGGMIVEIRGKHPKDESRKVCPTCLMEIIEQARANTNCEGVEQLLQDI